MFFVNKQMKFENVLEILLNQVGVVHSVFDSLDCFSKKSVLLAKSSTKRGNIHILYFVNILYKFTPNYILKKHNFQFDL